MIDTKMVKTAGEHWACSMLARHGWAPALTRDGTERTDVLTVSKSTDVPTDTRSAQRRCVGCW
jgi:hypothetical protein